MLNKKRKKVVKYRGSHTHGGGSKKKRRGYGHKGGRGLSGSGKKGDQKKSWILKNIGGKYFGKYGFNSIHSKTNNIINLGYINNHFEDLIEKGIIVKENNDFVLNLANTDYDKILSKGDLTQKLNVVCEEGQISNKAKLKIEANKGKIIMSELVEKQEE